jgi:hypothetical protein
VFGWRPLLGVLALLAAGCTDAHPSAAVEGSSTDDAPPVTRLQEQPEPSTTSTPTAPDPVELTVAGTVTSGTTGQPLGGARVTLEATTTLTADDGSFELTASAPTRATATIAVERAAWQPVEVELPAGEAPLIIELEPLVVRGIRVSREVAEDGERWRELLALADDSAVNTLVFDTKDEFSAVLYETDVAFANEIGAVDAIYDPRALIVEAKERGLYTITRIVTFEDRIWANADLEAKLAGSWIDAADPANWRYPIDLAVEACQLGFNEVQFDYVRFPSGQTAEVAAPLIPQTAELRSAAIADFLATARAELQAEGCGVSAAIFGIVMSSDTDERLGQTPETVSAVVDAVSPMLYPSHYNPGWLGFADPNQHPGPVIAFALDEGDDRLAGDSMMRPWIQGFYYSGTQIKAQIDEAEARGAGWIIWNAAGNYRSDWLPPPSASR